MVDAQVMPAPSREVLRLGVPIDRPLPGWSSVDGYDEGMWAGLTCRSHSRIKNAPDGGVTDSDPVNDFRLREGGWMYESDGVRGAGLLFAGFQVERHECGGRRRIGAEKDELVTVAVETFDLGPIRFNF